MLVTFKGGYMSKSFKISRVNFNSPDAPREFVESLKRTGFAVIENHDISPSLLEDVYKDWSRFFASEGKHVSKTKDGATGYFPFKSENAKDSKVSDLKEFFHVYRTEDVPAGMNEVVTMFLKARLSKMAAKLLGWIEENTPRDVRSNFSEPLPAMIQDSPNHLFRILHYPPLSSEHEEGAVRAGAHEDINLITLLPAATTPGLQVKGLDGNWYEVECDPGAIIVNVGDMLQLASGGYYKSTTHQVVNPMGEAARHSRYSMPLFCHPRSEVKLSNDKTAGQYLNERLAEIMKVK